MLKDTPLFSVVIPLYNRADTIVSTLRSVLSQTTGNFEIIVVDDGSNDNPGLAIASLKDARIRHVCQANSGGGAARNRGIEEARGRYIAFLDSDDTFLPNKLERMVEEMPLGDDEVLYSSMRVDRGVGKYWIRPERAIRENEDVGEYLFVHNQLIQTSTIVLPSALAKRVKFDGSLRKGQDTDFCLRLQHAGARFRMIKEPLTIWTDATEVGRTSHTVGYKPLLTWFDKCGPLMTDKAKLGYRATVLAYFMGRHQPFTTARDLWLAWVFGGVPSRIIARQVLRAYMPQKSYRRIVNAVVKLAGARTA